MGRDDKKLRTDNKGVHITMSYIYILIGMIIIGGVIALGFLSGDGGGGVVFGGEDIEAVNEEQQSNALALAREIAKLEPITENITLVPDNVREIDDAVYAGLVSLKYFSGNAPALKEPLRATKFVLDGEIREKAINDMIPLYNRLLEEARQIDEEPSSEDLQTFLSNAGELSGKVGYIAVRSEAEIRARYIRGLWNLAIENNITGNVIGDIASFCNEDCVNTIIDFTEDMKEGLAAFDAVLYDLSGSTGHHLFPSLSRGISTIEYKIGGVELPKIIIPDPNNNSK